MSETYNRHLWLILLSALVGVATCKRSSDSDTKESKSTHESPAKAVEPDSDSTDESLAEPRREPSESHSDTRESGATHERTAEASEPDADSTGDLSTEPPREPTESPSPDSESTGRSAESRGPAYVGEWKITSTEGYPGPSTGPLENADAYIGRCLSLQPDRAWFPSADGGAWCDEPTYETSPRPAVDIAKEYRVLSSKTTGSTHPASPQALDFPDGEVLDVEASCEKGASNPFQRFVVWDDQMWTKADGTLLRLIRSECNLPDSPADQ